MRIHPSLSPRDLPPLFDALPVPVAAVDHQVRVAAASAAWAALDPACTPGEPAAEAVRRVLPGVSPAEVEALLSGRRDELACDAPGPGRTGPARLVRRPAEGSATVAAVLALVELPPGADRYRRFVEEANDIIFALDRQGRFTEMNRRGCELAGYTPDELLGRPAIEFVPPEQRAGIAEILQRVWAGECVAAPEVQLVFKNGERRWFEVKGRTIVEDGVITGTFHVARDITERRALAEARELLSRTAAAVPVVIWVVDMEGRFTLLEGGGLARYGLRPGELVGQSIFEFNRDAPDRIAQVRRGLAGEAFIGTGTWQDTTWEAHYVPLRDAEGCQVGLMAVVVDITERVRATEAGARADRLEALSILAGGIAHDFNNLLVGILGNAALALLDLPAGSPAGPLLEEIQDAARRMADLSRQMLLFSGRGQVARQRVDLNDVAAAAIAAAAGRVTIRSDLAPGLPPVLGDPAQLRLAISALLENAAEASRPGDEVTVRTFAEDAPAERFAGAYPKPVPAGTYVVVEVRDSGEGIDPVIRDRIFEPFFTTRFTGRGLGLAAAAGVARGHAGAILVDSVPGRGSAFRLYLPAAPAGPPAGS